MKLLLGDWSQEIDELLTTVQGIVLTQNAQGVELAEIKTVLNQIQEGQVLMAETIATLSDKVDQLSGSMDEITTDVTWALSEIQRLSGLLASGQIVSQAELDAVGQKLTDTLAKASQAAAAITPTPSNP